MYAKYHSKFPLQNHSEANANDSTVEMGDYKEVDFCKWMELAQIGIFLNGNSTEHNNIK